MTGKKYGEWPALEKIGDGGQGVVYKTKGQDGKVYAIKVVKVKSNNKKKLQRIKQEILIIKQLDNAPNIIKIYDDNISDLDEQSSMTQEIWYVMDYAGYGSLQHNDFYLNDVELGLKLFLEILKGVDAAHKAHVIHRDLKPENILLYPTQRSASISDFGLGLLKDDNRERITDPDEVLGPKHFMPPEQHKNPSGANEKSDIYSLGKILYYILTGKGKVFREEIGDIASDFTGAKQYLPLVQEKLLNRMVATDPKNRFDSVGEIIEDVTTIIDVMSRNTQRFIQKNEKDFSMYDIFVAGRRQEFINKFSTDLSLSVRFLFMVADELQVNEKLVVLSELQTELLGTYPRGKTNAAIKAAFMAVGKPEELKKHENERYSFASYFLASYFERASSHQLAHEHLVRAMAKENDPAMSLEYLLLLAKISKKCTCRLPHDFEVRIIELLQTTTDVDEKAVLYKVLGDHYLDINLKPEALRFLEAYLILKPYDETVRFECAYQYRILGQDALALNHYLLHQRTLPKPDIAAQNNLGDIYEQNDMDIKSTEMYRVAFDGGETLAGSNLASRLLDIGMVDEAEKILRKIISDNPDGDYSDQVHIVLGRISTKKDIENEKYEKLVKDGEIISAHNTGSVAALSNISFDWVGYWKLNEQIVVEVKRHNGVLLSSQRTIDKKALDLSFEGNTARVEKVDFGTAYESAYTSGVFYLVSNDEFKGYISKPDQSYIEVTGTRIPDIVAYDKQRITGLEALMGQSYKSITSG